MSDDLLQIGEFAKQSDTNLRTLRYYEELGLLRPVRRSSGKFRFYAPDQLRRIDAIKRLQGLGLSLQEIQEIMVPSGAEIGHNLETMRESLDRQIQLVDQRLESLMEEHRELKSARVKLDDCGNCTQPFGSTACDGCAVSSPVAMSILRSMGVGGSGPSSEQNGIENLDAATESNAESPGEPGPVG